MTGVQTCALPILDIPVRGTEAQGLFEDIHGRPTSHAFWHDLERLLLRNFGHAGPLFVRHLFVATVSYGGADILWQELSDRVAQLTESMCPPNSDAQVLRGAERFALLATAGEFAEDQGLVAWPAGQSVWAAEACFDSWLEGRGGVGSAEAKALIERFRRFIETQAARFVPLDVLGLSSPLPHNLAGYVREREHGPREYLLNNATFNQLCGSTSREYVMHTLAAAGLLEHDARKKSGKVVALPQRGRQRFFIIPGNILELPD